MKRASITEVKNGLSALLDQVKAGETIVITDRGIPVARIVSDVGADNDHGRVARLIRDGVATTRGGPSPLERILRPFPPGSKPAGVLEALLEERREGR
ncbi:MAG: type II toxin-antitoxin system prevent-host-death family antitoxin [Tepidiformaceae bacterium]